MNAFLLAIETEKRKTDKERNEQKKIICRNRLLVKHTCIVKQMDERKRKKNIIEALY